MIRDIEITADDAGFPIVRWVETRGLHAPGGPGQQRVECRIKKDPTTGELIFVARGLKREGPFEYGKPWEALEGFSIHPAATHFRSPFKQLVFGQLAQKSLPGAVTLTDSGQVCSADFKRDERVYINDADATRPELERLHLTLSNAFLGRKPLIAKLCDVMYHWPVDDPRVATYRPMAERPVSQLIKLLSACIVATVLACLAGLITSSMGIWPHWFR